MDTVPEMFNVGDQVSHPDGRGFSVAAIGRMWVGGYARNAIQSNATGTWHLPDGFVIVNPLKTYRVYKEVRASSADEARRMLGESFMVEEV